MGWDDSALTPTEYNQAQLERKTLQPRLPASTPRNLSKRQSKFLRRQLEQHSYESYREYLYSDAWRNVRERYRASAHPEPGYRTTGLPQTCTVCHDENVDLHHKTYKRLGEERLTDLVPLCRLHHDQLHADKLDPWTGPATLRQLHRSTGGSAPPIIGTS
jgi:hypothetical protein